MIGYSIVAILNNETLVTMAAEMQKYLLTLKVLVTTIDAQWEGMGM